MLEWLEIILLAFIQGLSEFLPISSSAHLVLPSLLFGWQDQGLFFDVVVHVGTLGAVLLYFRHELHHMLWSDSSVSQLPQPRSDIWKLALATVPVVVVGFFVADVVATQLRGLEVIAITTILFGLLLGASVLRSRYNDYAATENYLGPRVYHWLFTSPCAYPGCIPFRNNHHCGPVAGLYTSSGYAILLPAVDPRHRWRHYVYAAGKRYPRAGACGECAKTIVCSSCGRSERVLDHCFLF